MLPSDLLGFTWSPIANGVILPAKDLRKPNFILKKMLPEYVWDITQLEDNPMTFLDVQTLLQGTTVGGYRVEDQVQVLNQCSALKELSEIIAKQGGVLSRPFVQHLHSLVAKEEALTWGKFREGEVRIGGTDHIPPLVEQLDHVFEEQINVIQTLTNPVEQALIYFLWASMSQFFYDGNKRTARLVMNFILMRHGYYYLAVPADKKDEFNGNMVDFYNTKKADPMIQFLLSCYKNWD